MNLPVYLIINHGLRIYSLLMAGGLVRQESYNPFRSQEVHISGETGMGGKCYKPWNYGWIGHDLEMANIYFVYTNMSFRFE